MSVKKRIQHIASYYQNQNNVWDLCCDHGQIGREVSLKNPNANVYFVDQVPNIIKDLENKGIHSYITKSLKYMYITKDCTKLDITTSNNFIIIAGIGGILALKILINLNKTILKNTNILVSPHNNYFWLRQQLLDNSNFSILKESFVKEGKHFYEMFELTSEPNKPNWLIPEYYHHQKDQKEVQDMALKHYNYYKKAQNDPFRLKMLDFFETTYSAIIKQ